MGFLILKQHAERVRVFMHYLRVSVRGEVFIHAFQDVLFFFRGVYYLRSIVSYFTLNRVRISLIRVKE